MTHLDLVTCASVHCQILTLTFSGQVAGWALFDLRQRVFQWAASPAGRVPIDGSGSWPVVAAAAVFFCVISLCYIR